MTYREPGEDEEAKRAAEDAAEVGAFREKLSREAARSRRREYLWFFAGAALFFAFMFVIITAWNRQKPPEHREECHVAYVFHDDGKGRFIREPYLACPDGGGELPAAPTKP